MEDQFNENSQPVNPRRKNRSKMQIIKETYLPVIIAGVALILIVVFIIGSIVRAVQKKNFEKEADLAASAAAEEEQGRLDSEAAALLAQAEALAANYDYDGAIAVLNSFSGDLSVYKNLNDKIIEYETAQRNMVAWDDPGKIVNLSFQMLLADPERGFNYTNYQGYYGNSINKNFITTVEFTKILQQLYNNGYVLVDFDDFIETSVDTNGVTTYKAKTLYLPSGKKPLMLTQTNVNYNNYLIDSDGDRKPDAKGGGFASKLLWDGTNFTNEMIDANGNTVTGAFDLVPILENFIKEHPNFTFNGARATLALTGYNGLFGYRTQPGLLEESARQQAIQEATAVAQALRDRGYKLACYSYSNDYRFGEDSTTIIKNDLNNWFNEVVPILGELDIFAYPLNSDITSDTGAYSGEKFNAMKDKGFRYYLGICADGTPWTFVATDYIRQGRIMVTGSNLAYHANWFAGMFDAATVLDTTRGTVPR